jgi:hypothetical protein
VMSISVLERSRAQHSLLRKSETLAYLACEPWWRNGAVPFVSNLPAECGVGCSGRPLPPHAPRGALLSTVACGAIEALSQQEKVQVMRRCEDCDCANVVVHAPNRPEAENRGRL